MASITTEKTKGGDKRYVVHYRGDDGKSKERWHKRKIDAERFAVTTEADLVRGQWIDPKAGRITVGE